MKIEIPYYEDNTRISNSAIGWYIKKGPRYFRDMLDGKEEGLKLPQLERGTMIHEYILQPEEFWKDYVILDYETPKSKQQKDALEYYHSMLKTDPLQDQNKLKLKAYRNAYSNKYSDDKCIEEMEGLISTYQDYLQFLSNSDTRKVISFSDFNMLKKIKANLEEHIAVKKLLFDVPTTYTYHNEFHINWEYRGLQCKSLLDRVMFDHVNKKIILIDLKTTSDVYNFKHSVEEFDYYRQIAFYLCAITWYMLNELNLNPDDYDLEAYIIAIQTNGNYEVRVFDMFNEDELLNRKNLIADTFQKISYHINSNDWDHTIEYYTNDGIEKLST